MIPGINDFWSQFWICHTFYVTIITILEYTDTTTFPSHHRMSYLQTCVMCTGQIIIFFFFNLFKYLKTCIHIFTIGILGQIQAAFIEHIAWWELLGLSSRYDFTESSSLMEYSLRQLNLCHSFEDRASLRLRSRGCISVKIFHLIGDIICVRFNKNSKLHTNNL